MKVLVTLLATALIVTQAVMITLHRQRLERLKTFAAISLAMKTRKLKKRKITSRSCWVKPGDDCCWIIWICYSDCKTIETCSALEQGFFNVTYYYYYYYYYYFTKKKNKNIFFEKSWWLEILAICTPSWLMFDQSVAAVSSNSSCHYCEAVKS